MQRRCCQTRRREQEVDREKNAVRTSTGSRGGGEAAGGQRVRHARQIERAHERGRAEGRGRGRRSERQRNGSPNRHPSPPMLGTLPPSERRSKSQRLHSTSTATAAAATNVARFLLLPVHILLPGLLPRYLTRAQPHLTTTAHSCALHCLAGLSCLHLRGADRGRQRRRGGESASILATHRTQLQAVASLAPRKTSPHAHGQQVCAPTGVGCSARPSCTPWMFFSQRLKRSDTSSANAEISARLRFSFSSSNPMRFDLPMCRAISSFLVLIISNKVIVASTVRTHGGASRRTPISTSPLASSSFCFASRLPTLLCTQLHFTFRGHMRHAYSQTIERSPDTQRAQLKIQHAESWHDINEQSTNGPCASRTLSQGEGNSHVFDVGV